MRGDLGFPVRSLPTEGAVQGPQKQQPVPVDVGGPSALTPCKQTEHSAACALLLTQAVCCTYV